MIPILSFQPYKYENKDCLLAESSMEIKRVTLEMAEKFVNEAEGEDEDC